MPRAPQPHGGEAIGRGLPTLRREQLTPAHEHRVGREKVMAADLAPALPAVARSRAGGRNPPRHRAGNTHLQQGEHHRRKIVEEFEGIERQQDMKARPEPTRGPAPAGHSQARGQQPFHDQRRHDDGPD